MGNLAMAKPCNGDSPSTVVLVDAPFTVEGKVYCETCINAHVFEAASSSLAHVPRSPSARDRGAHHSHGQAQGSSEVWKIIDIEGKKGESADPLLGSSNKQFCQFMQTKMEQISACKHVLKCVAFPGGMTVVTQGLTAEEFQEQFVAMFHDVAGADRRVRVYTSEMAIRRMQTIRLLSFSVSFLTKLHLSMHCTF